MRHTMVKLTGLLMVLVLALSGCNLIGIDPMMQLDEDFAKLDKDYAAVVAEYDGGTVTKGQVLGNFASMYSYYAQMYSMFGMSMTNDVAESIKQQSVEAAVEAVAVSKELEKRGLSLSEDKLAEVEANAEESYQSAYDTFYAEASGKDEVRARQTEYDLYANGYTKEVFYNTQLDQANHDLLEEALKGEVAELSDEELQQAFDEKVAEDEADYASNVGGFESAMASEDDVVAWMPEGYRTVKHILIKPDEDALTAVTEAREALNDAQDALDELETEMDALNEADDADEEPADADEEAVAEEDAEVDEEAEAAEDEDVEDEDDVVAAEPVDAPRTEAEIQADIDAAQATLDAAKKAVEDAEAACLESVKDKTDEIYAKLEAGEDFNALIEEYGEDPGMQNEPTASRGYYVTAEQGNWDANFNAGAMALENVGDVTMTPVISTSGVHIIRYESDVTPGAVELDSIRDALYATTLETKQEEHYDETLTGLVEALNPVYHMEAFNVA